MFIPLKCGQLQVSTDWYFQNTTWFQHRQVSAQLMAFKLSPLPSIVAMGPEEGPPWRLIWNFYGVPTMDLGLGRKIRLAHMQGGLCFKGGREVDGENQSLGMSDGNQGWWVIVKQSTTLKNLKTI